MDYSPNRDRTSDMASVQNADNHATYLNTTTTLAVLGEPSVPLVDGPQLMISTRSAVLGRFPVGRGGRLAPTQMMIR
jgi:hypothetical protein